MDIDQLVIQLAGIPNMTPSQGRRVYEHLVESGARDVLEIGTAHGVSSCYMAAAIAGRAGKVTTVDSAEATALRDPRPQDVIAAAGLTDFVDRVMINDSSYTWWLKDEIARRSDMAGNCSPGYDFVYIDGAHNWTIDGLSVFLTEKLLRPGGWLLLDDLEWRYGGSQSSFGPGQGPSDLRLSPGELDAPHMKLVFDLIVQQHPNFSQFRIEDQDWGWAKKDPAAPRHLEIARSVNAAERLHGIARRVLSAPGTRK
jgi:predicted O-methyltransferase YrrM